MATAEVAPKQWQRFCERVQALAQNAMVSIQIVRSDGTTDTVARNVPLLRVALNDTSDPCNDNLVIETGVPGEKPCRHIVVEPIHIILRNEEGGNRYHRMEIPAESGTTIVTIHPGLSPELLES